MRQGQPPRARYRRSYKCSACPQVPIAMNDCLTPSPEVSMRIGSIGGSEAIHDKRRSGHVTTLPVHSPEVSIDIGPGTKFSDTFKQDKIHWPGRSLTPVPSPEVSIHWSGRFVTRLHIPSLSMNESFETVVNECPYHSKSNLFCVYI